MLIKTKDLIGAQLDWAVETLEIARMREEGSHIKEWWVQEKQSAPSPYSTDWLLGGTIIEREYMGVLPSYDGWQAMIDLDEGDCMIERNYGPTPLIAAMRCYLAAKLGDEVEVPDALL